MKHWILALVLGLSCMPFGYSGSVATEKLRASTVHLSVGTGFVAAGASGQKYLITNWHVCLHSKWKGTLTASTPEGPVLTGRIIKEAPTVDLCAARLSAVSAYLKVAPRIVPKQAIYTRGYPGHILSESAGRAYQAITWEVFFGAEEIGTCPRGFETVHDMRRIYVGCKTTFTSTLTDLYARPGSSGSPVVDDNGDLVGVISSWMPDRDTEAGMVPYADLKRFLGGL